MTGRSLGRIRAGAPIPLTAFRRVLALIPTLALVGALAVLGALVVAAPAGASTPAIDQSHGLPGFCPTSTGVTVVIDFQQLGGETIVRCNPSATPGTGLDALKGAGIQVAGVQRWGEAFLCRIENRPSAVEAVPIDGNPGYHEACINTPPAQAYWSYWNAGNNCGWQYSQWGVKNRNAVSGGFEGWSFSLNAGSGSNPKPRIAAVRPGTAGGGCSPSAAPGPSTNDPQQQQPAGGVAAQTPAPGAAQDPAAMPGQVGPSAGSRSPGTGSGSSSTGPSATGSGVVAGPGADALPAPLPRAASTAPAADDPGRNVAFTGGESAADVTVAARQDAGGSSVAPWAAGATMLALVVLALWTARRRRTREGS
ncbi:hypothetical protein [Lapillicoccus sp.]|uniref:hypothetical protein n=1 Tax=Lapillicoccus sp. TaxID=1909287 RepID=UPI0025D9091E|nr:hypothetical protein [Lapillicoccus sp.]